MRSWVLAELVKPQIHVSMLLTPLCQNRPDLVECEVLAIGDPTVRSVIMNAQLAGRESRHPLGVMGDDNPLVRCVAALDECPRAGVNFLLTNPLVASRRFAERDIALNASV